MADWIDNDIDIFNNIKNKGPFLGDDGASDGDNTQGSSIFNNDSSLGGESNNSNPFGGGGFGGGFNGGYNDTQNPSNEKKDILDYIFDLIIVIAKGTLKIIIGAFLSIGATVKLLTIKNADYFLQLSRIALIIYGVFGVFGLISGKIGFLTETTLQYIGYTIFGGCFLDLAIAGTLTLMLHLCLYKPQTDQDLKKELKKIEETSHEYAEIKEIQSDYEETFDDIMNSILGEEEPENTTSDIEEPSEDFNFDTDEEEEPEEELDEPIQAPVITPGLPMNKEQLWNTFAPMFKPFNRNFDKYEIWKEDNEFSGKFEKLQAVLRRIIADVYNMTIEELDESGFELNVFQVKNALMYCYIELQKPNKKQIKPDVLQQYLDNYSSALLELLCNPKQLFTGEDAEVCNKVSSAVKIDGDRFKITITKPNKDPILLGDIFIKEETKERMINEKTQPITLGINSIGHPIVYGIADKARPMFSGTIGGPPSSGKSWFIQAWLVQLLAFFLPEEVQVIVVDPKGDPVFNAFIPHPNFCRLIQGDNPKTGETTYNLIKTLIDEGTRRQEMFGTQNVSDIQGWRKKGNKLPTIYCFIDELPTLIGDIEEWGKEANEQAIEEWQEECDSLEKGQTKPPKPKDIDYRKEWGKLLSRAVTKLRASGIYIYVISQRLTGYVDKTFRDLTPFRIVLRGMELLPQVFPADGLKNFTQKLVNAGDSAVQLGDGQDVQYVKTLGVCLNEDDLYPLIENISKAFYKMGVEMPDMSVLGPEFVKDLNSIKKELYKDSGNVAQFDETTSDEDIKDLKIKSQEIDEIDTSILDDNKEDSFEQTDDEFSLDEEDDNIEDNSKNQDEEPNLLNNIEKIDEDGTIHLLEDENEDENEQGLEDFFKEDDEGFNLDEQ